MKEYDITNLDKAVDDFEKTIGALSDIQAINRKMEALADRFDASGASICSEAATISKASTLVSENVRKFTDDSASFVVEMRQSVQNGSKVLAEKTEESFQSISAEASRILSKAVDLQSETEALRTQVQQYTVNTRQSFDELRIQSNDLAREIRDKLSESDRKSQQQFDSVSTQVEQLSEDISQVKALYRRNQTLATIGMVSAICAALASILQFFLP